MTSLTGSAYIVDFEKMPATRNPNPDDKDDEKNVRKDGGVDVDRWRIVRGECTVGDTSQAELGIKARTHEGTGQHLGLGHWLPDKNEDSGKHRSIS
ncbi:hypothetical protein [Frondihabitans cladoniiphilus]|uniref:hypothetical protein n=1 Tax=Frondihabitans cladoniiphilus TaxID=715785 RepID=UPI0031E5B81D